MGESEPNQNYVDHTSFAPYRMSSYLKPFETIFDNQKFPYYCCIVGTNFVQQSNVRNSPNCSVLRTLPIAVMYLE